MDNKAGIIYKYQLDIVDEQVFMFPKDSAILTIQVQHGKPCLWVLHQDSTAVKETYLIEIYGTGRILGQVDYERYPNGRGYIGTFQEHDGNLVWHVFLLRKENQ